MLYIFGGLPGTGKSTLARHVAAQVRGVHVRIDTIEHALRQTGGTIAGPEGYMVGYGIAVEVICSDLAEHRHRVESRSADIEGFRLPTWEDVVNRDYRPWDPEHIVVDTAGQTVDESVERMLEALGLFR